MDVSFPEWVEPMAATLTQERFVGPESDARDIKSVRRWFVETFYFEARR